VKKPYRNVLLVIVLLVLVVASWFGYAVFIQFKRAKMASQCAILSVAIAREAADSNDAGKPFNLDEFLSHYENGTLFRRDQAGHILDSWGHPLVIEQTEHDGCIITRVTSVGRDGNLGTVDDHFREYTFAHRKPNQP
jgi:hypothetical protein